MTQLAALLAVAAVNDYQVMLGAALTVGLPDDEQHIQRFLSSNCFGDHVSRAGLDVPTRELLTFAMLAALGGCEPSSNATSPPT